MINIREDWLPLVIMLFLGVLFLHEGLFPLYGTQVISDQNTDIRSYFYHARFFGFVTLQKGNLPLWNPYIYAGTPFIGTLQTAVFYPLNFPFLILPIHSAINWSIAFHLFLSGIFTYYLLKYYGTGRFGATISGIVYTCSAPQVMHIYAGHLNALTAMVWTPLMFLFVDRFVREKRWRYSLYLSMVIALQLLAGQPQYLFYSMIAVSLYLLSLLIFLKIGGTSWGEIRLGTFLFVVAVFLGLSLSAVQILPTAEMTKYSTRENLTYEWVSIFSFPPENLVTFLVPDFFGDMLKVPYWGKNYLWEMSAYVGIMPLILAAIALLCARRRIVWFFTGLAVVSVVLALGKHTPLLKLLYNYVPGFHLFRGNSKFIFVNALSLAVLSGFGADALIKGFDGGKRRFRAGILGFCILLTSGLLFLYSAFDEAWFREAINRVIFSGDFFNNPDPLIQKGFEAVAAASFRKGFLWAMALLMSGSAVLLLYSYGILKEKAFKASLLAIIVFDLFSFGMRYMVTFDSRKSYWDKDIVGFLNTDKEPFRVIAPEMDVNSGMASGLETLGGYDTIILKRYGEFINLSQGLPPDKPNLWMDIKSVNKLTDLLNARYLVLQSGFPVNNPAFRSVFDNGRYRVYQNMNALPRAFVIHDAKVINDRNNIFRELMSPDFNPASYVVLEEEPDNPINRLASRSPIPRFIEHSPNKVMVEAYLTEPGLLVLGDVYYPGWKAFVDGKEAKIYRANYIMRAVALPEGRHVVEFRYDPLSFKLGAIISLASLAFVAGILIWDWRKNEKIKGTHY